MSYYQQGYNKYSAKKTPCLYGHVHDSVKEASRCNELHLLLRAKQIRDLEFQKSYLIIPELSETVTLKEVYKRNDIKHGIVRGQHKTKKICIEQAATYKADFVYYDCVLKKTVIEDSKGVRTKEYILKRKLMRQLYCNENTIFIET